MKTLRLHKTGMRRRLAAAFALAWLAAALPRPAAAGELLFKTLYRSVVTNQINLMDFTIAVKGDNVSVIHNAAWNGTWQRVNYWHSTNDCAKWESFVVVHPECYNAPKWHSLFLDDNGNPVFVGTPFPGYNPTNLLHVWWSPNLGYTGTWANAVFTHTATPTNILCGSVGAVMYPNGNIGFAYSDIMPTPEMHYVEFTGSPATGYSLMGPSMSLGTRGASGYKGGASSVIGAEGRFRTFWHNDNQVRMAAITAGGGVEQHAVYTSGGGYWAGMVDAAVDPVSGKYYVTTVHNAWLRLIEFTYNETGGLIDNTSRIIATNVVTHPCIGFGANNELVVSYLSGDAPTDLYLQVREHDGTWHTNRLTGADTGYLSASRHWNVYGGYPWVNLAMAIARQGVKTLVYLFYRESRPDGGMNDVVRKYEMRPPGGTFVTFR